MKRILGFAFALAASISGASAAETLIFATTSRPGTANVTEVHSPWAAKINAAAKGLIAIDQRDGQSIANSNNYYDRVQNDVVQIVFGGLNFVPGVFKLSIFTTLPYVSGSSEDTAVAYWRLYKSGMLDAEFKDSVPLYFYSFPGLALHYRNPLQSLDDIKGTKIAVTNRTMGQMAQLLGATPISLTMHDLYQALQRGAVDAISWPFAGLTELKFDEITSYHVLEGLGSSPAMVFMAKKRWDALPAEARRVLEQNSGEAVTRLTGQVYDRLTKEIADKLRAGANHKVVELTPERRETWRRTMAPIVAEWESANPGGKEVIAKFRTLLAEVQRAR